jgi:hypothetical protein
MIIPRFKSNRTCEIIVKCCELLVPHAARASAGPYGLPRRVLIARVRSIGRGLGAERSLNEIGLTYPEDLAGWQGGRDGQGDKGFLGGLTCYDARTGRSPIG